MIALSYALQTKNFGIALLTPYEADVARDEPARKTR